MATSNASLLYYYAILLQIYDFSHEGLYPRSLAVRWLSQWNYLNFTLDCQNSTTTTSIGDLFHSIQESGNAQVKP